jgi:integrase
VRIDAAVALKWSLYMDVTSILLAADLELLDIIEARPRCACPALFVTVRAPYQALTGSCIRAIMGRACASAGLPQLGAHRLRHTLATELLRAGAPLAEVGQVLRHRSQLSTAIYAKVDHAALRALAQPWPGGTR